jgi:hypothetical protein
VRRRRRRRLWTPIESPRHPPAAATGTNNRSFLFGQGVVLGT